MIACHSGVTTLHATLAEDIQAAAEAGCTALEVWLTKLEDYLQGGGPWARPDAVRKLLSDRGVRLLGAAYQGGLLLTSGAQRREHFDQFQRRLGLCQEFDIPTLLLVPDVAERIQADDFRRAQEALAQAAELASSYDVRLALEFRSTTPWCSSLPTAAGLVASVGSPQLGLCLDLFHYYTGPSKFEDLALLSRDNLFAVQLCDLAGTPREWAADSDRILPGEGDFLIGPIIEHLRRIGYQGYVSAELMNSEFWKMKPAQVAHAAYSSLRVQLEEMTIGSSLQAIETSRAGSS
jgi:2-keto-myo-inositol isomerase